MWQNHVIKNSVIFFYHTILTAKAQSMHDWSRCSNEWLIFTNRAQRGTDTTIIIFAATHSLPPLSKCPPTPKFMRDGYTLMAKAVQTHSCNKKRKGTVPRQQHAEHCRHRPHFHKHAKQTTPSADELINDKRASPTHEVATDVTRCNVCLADVQLEALWGPTKGIFFHLFREQLP